MRAAHDQAVACRNRALPLLDPPGERVAIPCDGHTLYGNLRRPPGVARPPVVVMAMGLDSAKEEMHTNETVFLDRGLATFAFDGPGQGEAEYDLPIQPEYEEPVAAVIDCARDAATTSTPTASASGASASAATTPRAPPRSSRA